MGKFYSNITGKSYTSESMRATDEHKYLHNEKLRIANELRRQNELNRKEQRENTERIINGGLTNKEILEREIYNAAVQRFGEEKVVSGMKILILLFVAIFMGIVLLAGGKNPPAVVVLFCSIFILVARWSFDLKSKNKIASRICLVLGLLLLIFPFLPLKVIGKVIPAIGPKEVYLYGAHNYDGITVGDELYIHTNETIPITSVEIIDDSILISWSNRRGDYKIKFYPYEFCLQTGVYEYNLWDYESWTGHSPSISLKKILEDYNDQRYFTSD